MTLTEFIFLVASPTPTPFNENSVTPTWVGFAFTFGIGLVTILLIIDMTRRVRRTKYRGEIREQLEAERAEAEREAGRES